MEAGTVPQREPAGGQRETAGWIPADPGPLGLAGFAMTRTRQGAGSVETAWGGSRFAQTACPHGRQAAHRSASAASGIDASRRVQSAAVSRSDVSLPPEHTTTRKRCWGVWTCCARPQALHARARAPVSGGRSGQRSAQKVSGSVGGSCMVCSCVLRGNMVSMPYAI